MIYRYFAVNMRILSVAFSVLLAFVPDLPKEELAVKVEADYRSRIAEAIVIQGKESRKKALETIKEEAVTRYEIEDDPEAWRKFSLKIYRRFEAMG